jgi:hypothetical protein
VAIMPGATRYKPAFFVAVAALAVSVAWQLRRGAGSGPDAAASSAGSAAATSESAPPDSLGAVEPIDPALSGCRERLARCEQSNWEVVLRAIRQDAQSRHAQPPGTDPRRQAGPSEFEQQERALCDIAEEHVCAHWIRERDNVFATLRDVGTEQWADKWLADKMKSLQERFGLDATESKKLESSYARLWTDYGPRLHGLVNQQPPDYRELISEVRDFWQDEDRMMAMVMGKAGRDAYREVELKSRTAIVAILAAYADLPWDEESIGW